MAAVVYPLRMAVVLQGLIACLRPSGSPLVDKGLVIPISALGPKALRADIPQGQQNVSVRIAQFGVQRDVGGYAVAKGGVTELRLYNPVSMEFDRTLAAVQGTVRSIAVRHDGGKTEELFMLCDTGDGGNRIRVYDMESGSERVLDGAVPCSEIVLAR